MSSTAQIGESEQSLCTHQGEFDACIEPVPVVFGSDRLQGHLEAELGVSSTANGEELRPAVPAFCGGAGDHVSEDMTTAPVFEADDETQNTESLQGQSVLDFVLQNLQCKLGNPKNRCYANAPFRLWMWTGSFLSGPEMWHCTAKAVHATFQADDVVNLTELTDLSSLWQKFDDTVQDDAAHFLAEMVELAKPKHVTTHHFHVDHRQTVHRRKEFPNHLIFENQNRPQEFEELIKQWANTAEGQVLDGTGLWVAQIGRYSFTAGEWTKHHQILNVPSLFNLPVTQDGTSTKTEQFSVVGFLCHSGTAHKSGHFYAVFCYRGLLWLVDDGSFPRPIQCMHDTMRMQIVQVWAVPSIKIMPTDIPRDIPLSQPESDLQQQPKRRCLAGTGFSFANVTQLGQQVRQWLVGRERKPTFLVETHLSPDDHDKTMQWFATRGFGVLGQAAALSPKGGTHGGMILLYPAHLHIHYVQKQLIDGCGWYAVHGSFDNFALVVVMAYFKCGEGIQGQTNTLLWSGLMTFVTGLAKPVIVVGDFNTTPEEFMATTMSSVMQVSMLATGEDTCLTGRELDWALVSTNLIADTSISADWIVPFKPHAQLHIHLAKELQSITVQQIQRYQPAPKLQQIKTEWTQVQPADVAVNWLDLSTNNLSQKAGQLYSRIERYVLQNLDKPTLGRGTNLQYVQKPLVDPSKPWLWRRVLAFWSQIELRLQQHLHRRNKAEADLHHLEKLGWHVPQHWRPDDSVTLEGFMMLYNMLWGEHDNEHVRVLLKFVKSQWSLYQDTVFQTETQEYRNWMNAASQKGCRGLYRTLKKDELPYARPFQQYPRAERMEKRIQQWSSIWQQKEQPSEPRTLQALVYKGQKHAKELQPLHAHQVWQVIKRLSQKAPGLDAVGYDYLKELPFQAMPDLVAFFHEVEAQATVPNQWTTSLIALLPKTSEIERPIALVASLYRLWCKVRAPYTQQWQHSIKDVYIYLGAGSARHRMPEGSFEESLHDRTSQSSAAHGHFSSPGHVQFL